MRAATAACDALRSMRSRRRPHPDARQRQERREGRKRRRRERLARGCDAHRAASRSTETTRSCRRARSSAAPAARRRRPSAGAATASAAPSGSGPDASRSRAGGDRRRSSSHVERAARLEPRVAQIVAMHADDRQARQQRVAVLAAVTNDAQAGNAAMSSARDRYSSCIESSSSPALVVDFLQRVDVAVELSAARRDARGAAAPVQPDAAVDVVGADGDAPHGATLAGGGRRRRGVRGPRVQLTPSSRGTIVRGRRSASAAQPGGDAEQHQHERRSASS